jgi:hypothetical protein
VDLIEGLEVGLGGGVGWLLGEDGDLELGVVFTGVGVAPDFKLSNAVDSHHVISDLEETSFLIEDLITL